MDYNAELFSKLISCKIEDEVTQLILKDKVLCKNENWFPINMCNIRTNPDVKKTPIIALADLLNTSINSLLVKQCLEKNISFETLINRDNATLRRELFPESTNWNSYVSMGEQSENIQLIAEGTRFNTSLTIIDKGPGLTSSEFENYLIRDKYDLFLHQSIISKHAHATSFCGENGYMFIGSKAMNSSNSFTFTILKKINLTNSANSYKFLKIGNQFPEINLETSDFNTLKQFKYGTIKKLYSYKLPSGSRSVITRDLLGSLEEFLFNPVLPILLKDQKNRYDSDLFLNKILFGLNQKLKKNMSKDVEVYFDKKLNHPIFGTLLIEYYIFNESFDGKHEKHYKGIIKAKYFKNKMSVLFSNHGTVYNSFDKTFIIQKLNLPFLVDHLLIHIDCTNMDLSFWKEYLSEETSELDSSFIDYIVKQLKSNQLDAINSKRCRNT